MTQNQQLYNNQQLTQSQQMQQQQLLRNQQLAQSQQLQQQQLLRNQQLTQSQQMQQQQLLRNQQLAQSKQFSQTQQIKLNQGINNIQQQQIRQTNSLTNNQPFAHKYSQEIKQSRTQMIGQNYPFQTKTSSPLPAPDISQKLISLAQMASMQNEANPNYKNLQAFTLEQQNQEAHQQEQDEIQEYQPQEETPQYNYEEQIQEPAQETDRGQTEGNPDIEALFFTEDGRVIFRNGLLRGIIHKYIEIDEVVSKIQDILCKGVKFNLVYKAFDSGDKAKIFHEKCDNLNMSLVLIETDQDVRFGGFTTKNWQGNCVKKR